MEIKNVKVYGLNESLIRSGYPMKTNEPLEIGNNFELPKESIIRGEKLAKAPVGSGHNNFLKGIIVQFDLKYTQYFTIQLQRYNWIDIISSQSKMHKLTSIKSIGEHCNQYVLKSITTILDELIQIYNYEDFNSDLAKELGITSKEKCYDYIISNLPMGYEMWMGISTNYLQLKTIYKQRKNHKLSEWKGFTKWIETLPMNELITQ